MKICPICHGNGFVAHEPEKILEYPEITSEFVTCANVCFSPVKSYKDCDHCMNSGEIPD